MLILKCCNIIVTFNYVPGITLIFIEPKFLRLSKLSVVNILAFH